MRTKQTFLSDKIINPKKKTLIEHQTTISIQNFIKKKTEHFQHPAQSIQKFDLRTQSRKKAQKIQKGSCQNTSKPKSHSNFISGPLKKINKKKQKTEKEDRPHDGAEALSGDGVPALGGLEGHAPECGAAAVTASHRRRLSSQLRSQSGEDESPSSPKWASQRISNHSYLDMGPFIGPLLWPT